MPPSWGPVLLLRASVLWASEQGCLRQCLLTHDWLLCCSRQMASSIDLKMLFWSLTMIGWMIFQAYSFIIPALQIRKLRQWGRVIYLWSQRWCVERRDSNDSEAAELQSCWFVILSGDQGLSAWFTYTSSPLSLRVALRGRQVLAAWFINGRTGVVNGFDQIHTNYSMASQVLWLII